MAWEKRKESDQFSKIKKRVKRRDKYTCQLCCKKKRSLQVHHIIRYADSVLQREDEHNLITLCFTCHKSISGREHIYRTLFTEIVLGKYKK